MARTIEQIADEYFRVGEGSSLLERSGSTFWSPQKDLVGLTLLMWFDDNSELFARCHISGQFEGGLEVLAGDAGDVVDGD